MIATTLRRICICVAVLVALLSVAFAQSVTVAADGLPDYAKWETVAKRAEDVLASGRASTDAFEVLREDLADWRSAFIVSQSANSNRIKTLQDQIATLGAAPAEGETEPTAIAERRAQLDADLATAQVPVLRAEEAYTRANGLVREVDDLVRERQTDRTLKLDPSPLNPANWSAASRAVGTLGQSVKDEFVTNSNSEIRITALKDNLPLSLACLVVGFVLLTRSSAWIERGLERIRARRTESRASFRVGTFIASIFGFVLPFFGLLVLLFALVVSDFFGEVSSLLIVSGLEGLATVIAAVWLGREVFPKSYPPSPIIPLTPPRAAEARMYTTLLGLSLGFFAVVEGMADEPLISRNWSDAVLPVFTFPVVALAGVMLFRLSQLMLSSREAKPDDSEPNEPASDMDPTPARAVTVFLARASMMVGVIAPILVAIGYVTAGGMVLSATVATLGVLGLVAVLQRFARDVFAMIFGDDVTGSALVPVLISFALVLMAVPFLALIWGARVADLSDAWSYVTTGFDIGGTRISVTDFMTFVVIFCLGYGLTKLLQSALNTQVLPKTKLDTGGRNAVVAGTGYIGIFLAALLAITGAGIDLSSLAIVAGALSVGIGFGLQTIVSNFVSGIILLIERPISEGDWIEVGTTMGVVKQISVRATTIETFDRTDVIVPNADLIAGSVTNWTKGNLSGRLILPVGVAYGSDTRRVEAILREIAEAHPVVIVVPPPAVLFMNFGADALEFEVRCILRDVNFVMSARSDINHEIAKRFAEEGIEVPFAQRDLWLRNPEALSSQKEGS